MRIIHSLEGKSWSGGQQQALFLARGMKNLGHQILLVSHHGGELAEIARNDGIEVIEHDFRSEASPISIFKLNKIFNSFKPDIVNVHRAWAHTQWLMVSLLNRFRGLIVTRRVLFKPDTNPLSLVKYRSSGVRSFIAVSDAVSERLKGQGVSPGKIKVIYSATDTDRFNPANLESLTLPLPFDRNLPYILFVGNYSHNKGHHLVAQAFSSVSSKFENLQLVIAGHFTDSEKLADEISRSSNNNRIHVLGFRKDVPALMSKASLYINASYQEGFSGTIREALSMGLPVVASDIPANLEAGRHAKIFFFRSGDKSSLSEAITTFFSSDINASFKEELRRSAEKVFGIKNMVECTLNYYQHQVNNNA
ncbi:MAG: glycosyltransferase family 4 protein [Candidatus Riflebacteria bacterium]|nr:glycosyltransferase family 4 protein [Candidatus Riflebacteria bacterium]